MKTSNYALSLLSVIFIGCGSTSEDTSKSFTVTTYPSTVYLVSGMKKDILLSSNKSNTTYEIIEKNGNVVLDGEKLILRADDFENGKKYIKLKAINPSKKDSLTINISYQIITTNQISKDIKIVKTGANDGGSGLDRNFSIKKSKNTNYILDPLGNRWNLSTKKKPFKLGTYFNAKYECEILKLLNKDTNWRVPTKDELLNLINYSKTVGTNMIEDIFGDENLNSTWAKSENGKNLVVSQYNAMVNYIDNFNFQKYPVRCIDPIIKDKVPHIVSTDRGTEETYDYSTALVWSPIQERRKIIDDHNETAFEYCKNLNLNNKSNWRMPSINELRSITEDGMISYMIRGIDTILVSSTPYKEESNSSKQKLYYSLFIQNGMATTGISPANDLYGITCVRSLEDK